MEFFNRNLESIHQHIREMEGADDGKHPQEG